MASHRFTGPQPRNVFTRIAALRQMTEKNGCTREEADTAKRILDGLLKANQSEHDAKRDQANEAAKRHREQWQCPTSHNGKHNWDYVREGDYAECLNRCGTKISDADLRHLRDEDKRVRAAAARAEEMVRRQAEARRAQERAREKAQADARARAARAWAEEARAKAKKEEERKAAEFRAAAYRRAEEVRRQEAEAKRAREQAYYDDKIRQKVVAKQRGASERDQKLDTIERSPFRMREGLKGGRDACPLCHVDEGLHVPGITMKGENPTEWAYECQYCGSQFDTVKVFGDYWMYRVTKRAVDEDRTHRYKG